MKKKLKVMPPINEVEQILFNPNNLAIGDVVRTIPNAILSLGHKKTVFGKITGFHKDRGSDGWAYPQVDFVAFEGSITCGGEYEFGAQDSMGNSWLIPVSYNEFLYLCTKYGEARVLGSSTNIHLRPRGYKLYEYDKRLRNLNRIGNFIDTILFRHVSPNRLLACMVNT